MYPYINLKIIKIPTYGLMLALGILLLYIFITLVLSKKEKMKSKAIDSIIIITLISFIALGVSACLFNSLFHSIENKKIAIEGFTWLGGVLVGFPLSIFLYERFAQTEVNGLAIFDLVLPGVILAHGFGRIGCFLAGCCYGGVTDSFLGVCYPTGTSAFYDFPNETLTASLPLWPTQLFETAFDFILFAILMILRDKTKNKAFEIYAFSYGVFRFLIEFLRADDRGSTGLILSPSQIMSIILILYGVIILLYKKKIIFKSLDLDEIKRKNLEKHF